MPFTTLTLELAVGRRDSRGIRSLGKTPDRALAKEEAYQLPAGKRVVPQQALAQYGNGIFQLLLHGFKEEVD
ncbi:hypothetical protein GCM10011389_06700 [Pontibacillus salipaludis]|uniref:Uncharacterized protein n=1 Tax=Pontibacillus salipaludis TaxID=1697394 RepID=A0ABQ1PRN4_9BACI|nr:hypothetical protein GCM10011389_06700 [Pontibacillus salipaludis]